MEIIIQLGLEATRSIAEDLKEVRPMKENCGGHRNASDRHGSEA
ncbi:hypothetical protein [Cupriavidus necator]|nr:hypothetical protein [Cupriavidus necator]